MAIYVAHYKHICLAPSKRNRIGTSKNRADITAYPSQDILTLVI